MEKLKGIIFFIFREFGPLILFYGVNHYYGLKPALIVSLSYSVCGFIYRKVRGQKISLLFLYSIASTLAFGFIDLYMKTPVFIKFESAISNTITGLFFLLSLRAGSKPIIQECAEQRWEKNGKVVELTEDRIYFLWFSTAVWSFYFFAKAVFYAWVGTRYTLEEGLAIRSVVGNSSFYGLMFINIYFPTQIRALLAKARLLPSSRA
jgi:intracellular septation protein A